jgi:PAS domain S-box-containing protein
LALTTRYFRVAARVQGRAVTRKISLYHLWPKGVYEKKDIDDMQDTFSLDWLCRRIVAESRDAIIFADKDGLIRLWNAGAEALFGYRGAEMEGQGLDRIIPEALRARHDEGYRRALAAGASRYAADLLAVPGLKQDGSRLSLEFTITLVKGDNGEVLGAAAIIRDVTARWQREQEMKKRLAMLEGLGAPSVANR